VANYNIKYILATNKFLVANTILISIPNSIIKTEHLVI